MTNCYLHYRSDSDVPTPYGRTVALPEDRAERMTRSLIKDIIPFWQHKQRDVLVAAAMSHYVPERINYIYELQEYLKVDLFGNCSDIPLDKRE